MRQPTDSPLALLQEHAPWLLAPDLGVCVVGSAALAEACRRAGAAGPRSADLDLAWALDVDAGEARLREHGVFQPTTAANRARGTLSCKLAGHRIEVTTFRAGDARAPLDQRIRADLLARDMTVGALAWRLSTDEVLDPCGGLDDWRARRIVPVGDPAARIAEHPVRWLRYYRRAHEWGFELDDAIRRVRADRALLRQVPAEAVAAELRAALLRCRSPGALLLELHEVGLLAPVAPELAPQFDCRPAGPWRYHPEVSQALHVILCLEWIAERSAPLPEPDRLAAALAVLCHDLGKADTAPEALPSHPGHERAGVARIDRLLDRLPGLADGRSRRLAKAVARLHLLIRRFDELRPGTLASMYERDFRAADFPVRLFALAVGADAGGRLGLAASGDEVAAQVERDITWLRARCAAVDASRLRERFADDTDGFRRALHQARAAALRSRG